MRVIVAGSRAVKDWQVWNALNHCGWIGFATAIVSGTAKGADLYGEQWAVTRGVEVEHYPADWERYGKRAGPIRNRTMAENAHGLVAVWDGQSRGTISMIDYAKQLGLRVAVYRTDSGDVEEFPPTGIFETLWELAEEKAGIYEYERGMSKKEAERTAGYDCRDANFSDLDNGLGL